MKQSSFTYYKDLVIALTQKELKVKYKRSFLGYLWSIANPLALSLVFFIAFKIFMKIQIENYTLFLISGLFPWQWFSNSVNSSAMTLVGNAPLIKKVNFRREVLVIATVLNDMLHFILSIPIIIIFVFFYGITPSLMWLIGIPILLIIQFIITFGFAVAVSSINLFFRDIERIVFIITTLMFYITPIIYAENMVPDNFKGLILLNPLSILMVSWRNLFMRGIINPGDIAMAFLYSLIVFAIGYFIFKRLRWRFAEVL
ncbi:MAG: ABC transporter permease [Nitrospirae bacterium]|nr:ABC transporter permease [Nitrospirota bacterium]